MLRNLLTSYEHLSYIVQLLLLSRVDGFQRLSESLRGYVVTIPSVCSPSGESIGDINDAPLSLS